MTTELESKSTGLGQRPCLLVVDATLGFTDPSSPLGSDYTAEIETIAKLMRYANSRSWPCYLSTVVYRSESEASVFREKLPALNVLVPDSNWVAIDPRLPDVETHTVIEKSWAPRVYDIAIDNATHSLIDGDFAGKDLTVKENKNRFFEAVFQTMLDLIDEGGQ